MRRLHRAHVAALDIDRSASTRDLSRFSTDVLRCDDLAKSKTTLAELLAEHGVETIAPHLAQRPEMLEVGTPPAVAPPSRHARAAPPAGAAAAAGPASYLYPPDKGWVRLDPSAIFDTISLVDLAILVDDPADIAVDAAAAHRRRGRARIARRRAAAEIQRRRDAARVARSAPGPRHVLEAGARGARSRHRSAAPICCGARSCPGCSTAAPTARSCATFPNVDLAESLCLLMDLETAAPELLTTALDRLELPAERRRAGGADDGGAAARGCERRRPPIRTAASRTSIATRGG